MCITVGLDQPRYLIFSGGDDNAIAVHYVEFETSGIPYFRLQARHLKAHAAQVSGLLRLTNSSLFLFRSQFALFTCKFLATAD